MTYKDILRSRLAAQRLTGEKPATPTDLLAELGAMQSQDYGMSKWAVGLRLEKSTHDQVEQAIDSGGIVRIHVLRPTWHLVRAADVRWMLDLTAPQIKAAMAFRDRQLELDDKIFRRCEKIIEKALVRDKHLPRTALMPLLNKAGILTDENRSSHILLRAELDGIICSGPRQGKQFTYALLDERVPSSGKLSPEEALVELTLRYFNGHGPATLYDFCWWSGLSVADGKKGIGLLGATIEQVSVGDKQYWFLPGQATSSLSPHKASSLPKLPPALLLPAFDEWIIGYTDRSGLFATEHERKIITTNGIFRPVLLCNGLAAGSWRVGEKKGAVSVAKDWFHPVSQTVQKAMKAAEKKYINFKAGSAG
jgi:hypothetical protein